MNKPRNRHGRGPTTPGAGRGRRERTRRGTAARSALALLGERPMHGYEIIAELEDRTQGQWRPSPGSIYPTLARLEERGLIVGTDDGTGKRQYALTDQGRERVAAQDPDAPMPWAEAAGGDGRDGLRTAVAEIGGQARQIGRFGTEDQRDAALAVLTKARADLYKILAD
ncbi:MAG: helix-turn-helix transcriptional regulator [Actinomycetia bacterium]|nr:helix-turn-helix transcriptional regulator [Actinomycetes bacterium]